MPKLWAEAWTRPGASPFQRVISEIPVIAGSHTSRMNAVGQGEIRVPADYDRIPDILSADPDTPANTTSTLIRIFSESQTAPIAEFLPLQRYAETDVRDPDKEIPGEGIERILAYARTEPFDWDGTDKFTSKIPDWVWAGRNIVPTRSFGELGSIREQWELYNDATDGTFTLTVEYPAANSQTTTAFDHDASAHQIQGNTISGTGLEGLSNVDDVVVSGSGTLADPWVITFYAPPDPVNMTVDDTNLIGGTSTLTKTIEGGLDPAPYTKSQTVDARAEPSVHGTYGDPAIEVVTTPLNTGSDWALRVNATGQFAGTQVVFTVTPGQTYQASIPVRPTVDGKYRLVIRDKFENLIKWTTPANVSLTAGSYQTLSVPDVVIPDGVTEVIFRVAVVSSAPAEISHFFVDWMGAEFAEGQAATTPGDILTQLYDHATSTFASRVVWDNGAGTPYLTLGFTAALDSNGNAWTDSDISLTVKRGLSFLGVISEFARMGYEWRLAIDDWQAGTWKLQVFNSGGMGTDHTTSAGPSIEGGADDVRRDIRSFLPVYSDVAVEGEGQYSTRVRNAALISAIGRIEGYRPFRDLGPAAADLNAAEALTSAISQSQSLNYTVTGESTEPLVAWTVGDTLHVQDPPEVSKQARRVSAITLVFGRQTEYKVALGTESFVGSEAIFEAVRVLTAEFKAIRLEPSDGGISFLGGGGGAPTLVVAASDASDISKQKADFICSGTNDEEVINAAFAQVMSATWGRVLLTEGTYRINVANGGIVMPMRGILEGMGPFSTYLRIGADGASLDPMITLNGNYGTVRNVGVDGSDYTTNAATALRVNANFVHIEDCYLFMTDGRGIQVAGPSTNRYLRVRNVISEGRFTGGFLDASAVTLNHAYITGNTIWQDTSSIGDVIAIGDVYDVHITSNLIMAGTRGVEAIGHLESLYIADNTFDRNDEEAIYIEAPLGLTAAPAYITGNTISSAGHNSTDKAAIQITGDGDNGAGSVVVLGNEINTIAGPGIRLNKISGVRTTANFVTNPDTHGIVVIDGNDHIIEGNMLLSGALAAHGDGIRLQGTSSECQLRGNRIRTLYGVSTGRWVYGIHIVDFTCECNIVVGNQLGDPADYGTDALNNQGNDTQLFYPADAIYGDNFTICVAS